MLQDTSFLKLQPVPLDVELDYHGRMVEKIAGSLTKTKKRLFDAELTLNLRPADDEIIETNMWNNKVNSLLNTRDILPFPTLYQVKRQHEEHAANLSTSKKISSEEWSKRANDILLKQVEHLQQRVLNRGEQYTSKSPGTVIRTINNYEGCNANARDGTRTLIRKESKGWEEPGSSLPPWFGPLYYHPNADYNPAARSDSAYTVAFKSSSRHNVSSERARREKVVRRKKEIKEIQHIQKVVEQERRQSQRSASGSRKGQRKDFSIGFRDSSLGSLSPPRSPPSSAFLTSSSKAALLSLDFDDEGWGDDQSLESGAVASVGASTAESTVPGRPRKNLFINTAMSSHNTTVSSDLGVPTPTESPKAVSGKAKSTSNVHVKVAAIGTSKSMSALSPHKTALSLGNTNSTHSVPATAADSPSNRYRRHTPSKGGSNEGTPKKAPKTLSPLLSQNPFAAKLLGFGSVQEQASERFKGRDYTRQALSRQQSVSSALSYEYVPDEAEEQAEREWRESVRKRNKLGRSRQASGLLDTGSSAVNSSLPSVTNSRPPSDHGPRPPVASTTTVKFSSEIFRVPNISYAPVSNSRPKDKVSSRPASPELGAPATVDFSVVEHAAERSATSSPHLGMSPVPLDVAHSRPLSPELGVVGDCTTSLLNESTVRSRLSSPVDAAADSERVAVGEAAEEKTELVSPKASRVPFNKQHLANLKAIRSKRQNSTQLFINQVLGKDVAAQETMDASISPAPHKIDLSGADFDLDAQIKAWYVKNEVLSPTKEHKRQLRHKDSFLAHHTALPSIELSLNGLLLEENPHGADSELIKMNASLYATETPPYG